MELKGRDFYLLIDKSGSMGDTDTPTGQTRFKFAEEFAIALARKVEQYDPDGITVLPFSSSFRVYDNITAAKVADVFKENEPMGGTTLAPPLVKTFELHNAKKKIAPTKSVVFVITDGQPSDEKEVANSISKFTHTLENADDEFAIGFLQVGKDAHAKKYLEMLDDNLKGAKFDIVDAKTIEELENLGVDEIIKAALED